MDMQLRHPFLCHIGSFAACNFIAYIQRYASSAAASHFFAAVVFTEEFSTNMYILLCASMSRYGNTVYTIVWAIVCIYSIFFEYEFNISTVFFLHICVCVCVIR